MLLFRKNQSPAAHLAEEEKPKKSEPLCTTILTYYLMIMFSFFTLFLTKKYANSRHDKFYFYLVLSGVLIVGAGIAYFISRSESKRIGQTLSPMIKPVSVTDGAILCFVVFAAVSTFSSAYFPETLLAEVGRNNGLLLLIVYAAVYFIVTRMFVYKDSIIAVYLVFSCIVAGLTVINFFYLDPLGLLKGYSAKVAEDFGSTIGNKNTIASYMAMFLPISMMTLAINKNRWMRIIAGVGIIFAYAGVISCNSGSVIMALCVALPVMAIFCARKYEYLKRYMLALALMFAGGKVLRLFSYIMNDKQKGFEFTQDFLLYNKLTYIPIVVFGLLALMMYLVQKKAEPHYPAKVVTIILVSLTGLVIVGFLGAILYFTLVDTQTKLGALERLLRFDDRWGTHRGFMWIRAVREYGKFSFFEVLFGKGTDMAYYVLEPHFSELLSKFGNTSTNSVHNEYLNYLVTQGALGLISYLAILGGVCVRSIRRAKENPIPLIFISAVVSYAVQAVVNISTPVTTPVFFLFISMAEALNRQADLKHQ